MNEIQIINNGSKQKFGGSTSHIEISNCEEVWSKTENYSTDQLKIYDTCPRVQKFEKIDTMQRQTYF